MTINFIPGLLSASLRYTFDPTEPVTEVSPYDFLYVTDAFLGNPTSDDLKVKINNTNVLLGHFKDYADMKDRGFIYCINPTEEVEKRIYRWAIKF